jgi:hypothetical protein
MADSIESVKPILTVIDDEGDLIINSTGPRGKAMVQAVLALANSARKISVISDGEMRVMKRNPAADNQARLSPEMAAMQAARRQSSPAELSAATTAATPAPAAPDIQDQFAADLESGRTGEQAMGEAPSPTPGPSEAVKIPAASAASTAAARRRPQIFQDAAAPPAPELAEAEMARLLEEDRQAQADAARVTEDQRFQRQQAVQAGAGEEADPDQVDPAAAAAATPRPRRREPRQLATLGRPCGKCGGSGVCGTQDPAGQVFSGACPVCHGEGQVQTFARGPKFR